MRKIIETLQPNPRVYFAVQSITKRMSDPDKLRKFFEDKISNAREILRQRGKHIFFEESLRSVRSLVEYNSVKEYVALDVNVVYGIIDETMADYLVKSQYARFSFDTYFHERFLNTKGYTFIIVLHWIAEGWKGLVRIAPSIGLLQSVSEKL